MPGTRDLAGNGQDVDSPTLSFSVLILYLQFTGVDIKKTCLWGEISIFSSLWRGQGLSQHIVVSQVQKQFGPRPAGILLVDINEEAMKRQRSAGGPQHVSLGACGSTLEPFNHLNHSYSPLLLSCEEYLGSCLGLILLLWWPLFIHVFIFLSWWNSVDSKCGRLACSGLELTLLLNSEL